MCSFRNQRCEKQWLEEKVRLGMLNQTAGQGLIDNSEGCGKICLHKGINAYPVLVA
jgi:hypothetical protein